MEQRLKLNEFKALYKTLKTGVVWLDHLLLGLLLYLERKLIDNRVKNEVDKAINTVELPPLPDMVSPLYTVSQRADSETPSASANSHSKTSTRLPEMRLTAPWYDDTGGDPKGR